MDISAAPGHLSGRALRALQPALSYGTAIGAAKARPWTTEDPGGDICCCLAENKLTADLLHEKIMEVQSRVPLNNMMYPYPYMGIEEARRSMARMLQRTCMKGIEVDHDDLALMAGAGAVLELLFWCLAEADTGVMLPRPIYPAFINDMQVRSGCHPVLFTLDEDADVRQQLNSVAAAAAAEGHPVKVFLITNPNNPQGFIYKPDTMKAILYWCLDNHVHFISDEIYANSVFRDGGPPFICAEVLARQEAAEGAMTQQQRALIPELLHVVTGLSKDWCASGLRVGTLHTRNASLKAAMDNMSYFHCCSTPLLWTLAQVLSDDAFVDAFISENNRRMRESYQGLEDALIAHDIPHMRAYAAMFCWVDLREGLLAPGWEGERELWQAMMKVGVLFTPGEACKAEEPGFFRICWAWVPPGALPEAAKRLRKLLDERKASKASKASKVEIAVDARTNGHA